MNLPLSGFTLSNTHEFGGDRYGFLAESEPFGHACAKNGIRFIGPDARTIGLFGDKTEARRIAIENKVPVAAGSGPLKNAQDAIAFVEQNKVPYPILIKAAFGGGGRGQRLVNEASELASNLESCVKEAEMSFGEQSCPCRIAITSIMYVVVGVCVYR